MNLEDYGWNPSWQFHLDNLQDRGLEPARVVRADRGSYELAAERGRIRAAVTGTFRTHTHGASGFPAVGDWAAFRTIDRDHRIEAILPRSTAFVRKSAGRRTDAQVLAANIDVAFLVCGMDSDLNPRRLERYLTMTWESGATPVVLLNKTDIAEDPDSALASIEAELIGVDIHAISAATGEGLDALDRHIRPGSTVVLLGSSGAGKSTLANRLLGETIQATAPVRAGDDRGCHTTTRRELFLLPGGGILIDTPGLRELQLAGSASSLGQTFGDIDEAGLECRFRDCRHDDEPGCAVRAAVEAGTISEKRYMNFLKMRKEMESAEMRESPHLLRRRDRQFAKLVRRVVDQKRRGKADDEET